MDSELAEILNALNESVKLLAQEAISLKDRVEALERRVAELDTAALSR